MIQKIISLMFILMILLNGQKIYAAPETTVAVILELPHAVLSEPQIVHKNLDETLNKIFGDYSRFKIIPVEETSLYFQLYLEENDLLNSFDSYLKKENLSELDQYFESDYLIYVRVSNGISKFSAGLFSASQKVNVTTDFRVWSEEKSDYVYLKRFQETGKSTSVYVGIGSAEHAIEKGLKKALKQIEKDAVKIRAAMM